MLKGVANIDADSTAVQSRLAGALMVLGSGAIFSFTPWLFRGADESVGPWQFLAWRAVSAAAAMTVWLAARHGSAAVAVVRSARSPEVVAGLVLAGAFTLFILALDRVSTAMVLLLQALAPFVAALFGWVALRERVERPTAIAMVVALTGVMVMVGFGFGDQDGIGIALSLLLAVNVGLISVAMRRSADADPAVVPLIGTLAAAVMAVVMSTVTGGLFFGAVDMLRAIVAGGVLLGVGLPLYTGSHKSVPAAIVPLLLLSEIILAPVWVWVFIDEVPATSTIIGGVIVLAAVIGLTLASRNKPASV